jgi:Glycosyltransferase 61
MARGLPKWKKALDLKPWLAKLFLMMERRVPALTAAIGYFSRFGPPQNLRKAWIGEHKIQLESGIYRAFYDQIAEAAVDHPKVEFDPFTVKTQTWIIDDVILPGHTVAPVEAATRKIVSGFGEGSLNWGFAYPSPIFLRRLKVDGLACPIPPVKNYYHLLIDYLLPAAFAIIRHREDLKGSAVNLIVRKPVSAVNRIADALTQIGVRTQVVTIGSTSHVKSAPAFLAFAKHAKGHFSHGYWPGRERDILVGALNEIVPPLATSDLIYVPRTETRVRKLLNEIPFSSALESAGFRSFVARWGNFDEQFRTFAQAREIVAVHGAGLSNLCWSKPGTTVTEIMPENARRSHFLQIAAEQLLDYHLFLAGREERHQNFSIDIDAFFKARDTYANKVRK